MPDRQIKLARSRDREHRVNVPLKWVSWIVPFRMSTLIGTRTLRLTVDSEYDVQVQMFERGQETHDVSCHVFRDKNDAGPLFVN
jgi:hypothetical protein